MELLSYQAGDRSFPCSTDECKLEYCIKLYGSTTPRDYCLNSDGFRETVFRVGRIESRAALNLNESYTISSSSPLLLTVSIAT